MRPSYLMIVFCLLAGCSQQPSVSTPLQAASPNEEWQSSLQQLGFVRSGNVMLLETAAGDGKVSCPPIALAGSNQPSSGDGSELTDADGASIIARNSRNGVQFLTRGHYLDRERNRQVLHPCQLTSEFRRQIRDALGLNIDRFQRPPKPRYPWQREAETFDI